jgi:hypothetical protein
MATVGSGWRSRFWEIRDVAWAAPAVIKGHPLLNTDRILNRSEIQPLGAKLKQKPPFLDGQ